MILMHNKTYENRLIEIRNLKDEVEMLTNKNEKYRMDQKDLQGQIDYLMYCAKKKQERINRAIEYIEKRTKETDFDNDKLIDILDILKGSDSNE